MKYFKNETNVVYAYESDGSQDHIIPDNYEPITDQEAMLLVQPPVDDYDILPPAPTKEELLAKLFELQAQIATLGA